jgi:hypothetical protein
MAPPFSRPTSAKHKWRIIWYWRQHQHRYRLRPAAAPLLPASVRCRRCEVRPDVPGVRVRLRGKVVAVLASPRPPAAGLLSIHPQHPPVPHRGGTRGPGAVLSTSSKPMHGTARRRHVKIVGNSWQVAGKCCSNSSHPRLVERVTRQPATHGRTSDHAIAAGQKGCQLACMSGRSLPKVCCSRAQRPH